MDMTRTTMIMPDELQRQAQAEARRRGITVSELVRQALVRETSMSYQVGADPFWSDPPTFASAPEGQGTLAEHHDDELYGPVRQP
jgi:hypothetical protein